MSNENLPHFLTEFKFKWLQTTSKHKRCIYSALFEWPFKIFFLHSTNYFKSPLADGTTLYEQSILLGGKLATE